MATVLVSPGSYSNEASPSNTAVPKAAYTCCRYCSPKINSFFQQQQRSCNKTVNKQCVGMYVNEVRSQPQRKSSSCEITATPRTASSRLPHGVQQRLYGIKYVRTMQMRCTTYLPTYVYLYMYNKDMTYTVIEGSPILSRELCTRSSHVGDTNKKTARLYQKKCTKKIDIKPCHVRGH